ncbi:MAG: SpoVA/SpoVAEb family sporulation membrane protein [Coriobacteriales bacterium]|nr:SpoVA/SpoVAEb family sporulation membrane protein [Coriobacteriales bacterium]
MPAWKKVILSFFVGGTFCLVAQAILVCTKLWFTGTPFEFFVGGGTLVLMGVIGCILGGNALYQLLAEWADFGSFLPFAGFAMAVGMKSVNPYVKGESMWKCIWPALWLVIWFNAVGAIVSIAFGFICQTMGIVTPVTPANTTATVFPLSFICGGCISIVFQIIWEIEKVVLPGKAKHVHILLLAWFVGTILAPCGLSGFLASTCGEGFSVLITVGGYNMYNVGVDLAIGGAHATEGLIHLGSFLLAVAGLFGTGMLTFAIYAKRFGKTPINEVHAAMGQKLADRKLPKASNEPEAKVVAEAEKVVITEDAQGNIHEKVIDVEVTERDVDVKKE